MSKRSLKVVGRSSKIDKRQSGTALSIDLIAEIKTVRLAVALVPVLVAFGVATKSGDIVGVRARTSASKLTARLLVGLVLAVDDTVAACSLLARLGELAEHGAGSRCTLDRVGSVAIERAVVVVVNEADDGRLAIGN